MGGRGEAELGTWQENTAEQKCVKGRCKALRVHPLGQGMGGLRGRLELS